MNSRGEMTGEGYLKIAKFQKRKSTKARRRGKNTYKFNRPRGEREKLCRRR